MLMKNDLLIDKGIIFGLGAPDLQDSEHKSVTNGAEWVAALVGAVVNMTTGPACDFLILLLLLTR